MILGNIKDFDWFNEPENVSFTESGLQVTAQSNTDFWQNIDRGFAKDNGHFFFIHQPKDFVLTCKWFFEKIKDSAQCGVMVRINEHNWLKAGLLSTNIYNPQIGVVTADNGSYDWSMHDIAKNTNSIWLKLKRCGQDFVSYYSLDDQNYHTLRITHLSAATKAVKVGTYACSPKDEAFECVLEEINIKSL